MRSPSSPRYTRLTSLLFTLAGVASVVAGVHCGDDGNAGTGPGTTGSGGNGTSGSGGSGGSGTNAGSGGTAGSSVGGGASGGSAGMPNEGPLPTIAKVDVVLVVDNSASMADKQAILATAIRDLVGRLTAPDCVRVDENGTIRNYGDVYGHNKKLIELLNAE